MVETVNVNGELETNGDRWMIEKMRFGPCTITPFSSLASIPASPSLVSLRHHVPLLPLLHVTSPPSSPWHPITLPLYHSYHHITTSPCHLITLHHPDTLSPYHFITSSPSSSRPHIPLSIPFLGYCIHPSLVLVLSWLLSWSPCITSILLFISVHTSECVHLSFLFGTYLHVLLYLGPSALCLLLSPWTPISGFSDIPLSLFPFLYLHCLVHACLPSSTYILAPVK